MTTRPRLHVTHVASPGARASENTDEVRLLRVTRDGAMIGTYIGQSYRVLDKLGEGGMGVVYLVEHVTLHKQFAAKLLSVELARSADARARFELEAHAASQLEHEHIVSVTDYGTADDGRPYLIMELLRGRPLDERLAESRRAGTW